MTNFILKQTVNVTATSNETFKLVLSEVDWQAGAAVCGARSVINAAAPADILSTDDGGSLLLFLDIQL